MRKSKKLNLFQKRFGTVTFNRLETMTILDSSKHIRLLQDRLTGYYVVFNGRINQTHYARSYQKAEKYFDRLVMNS
ncbi:MAG: hypothetical protein AAF489_14245 [Bacteroidota bacterium]